MAGLLDYITEAAKAQYAKGAPYRNALGGLLSGDMTALQELNKPSPVMPNEALDVAMAFAPMGITKAAGSKFPLTEFEVKQLTAQRNAALPVAEGGLGLPASNTAMDRAKALGFNNNKWHETDVNGFNGISLEGFNPNRAVSAASDEQTPYSVFVKDSAKPVGIKIDNQMQMPLMTREGNSLSFNTRDGLRGYFNQYPDIRIAMDNVKNADKLGAAEIDKIGDEMFSYGRGNVHPNQAELWRQISEITGNNGMVNKLAKVSKEKITTQLKNDNIDSINLFKDEGSMGRAVNTQMILDPKNIRSRFAAFDPFRRNEADILAGVGVGVPVASGLLDIENKKVPKKEKKKTK
jgi:hypothetical protein